MSLHDTQAAQMIHERAAKWTKFLLFWTTITWQKDYQKVLRADLETIKGRTGRLGKRRVKCGE